jgi:hypothetical protein
MDTHLLVYPMFAMVLLTATVLVIMFRSRVRAVREKALASAYFRTFQGGTEPEYVVKPARHFINLFEAPTLFYAGCLAAIATQTAGSIVLALAWAYVAIRVAHAWIHIGRNRLRHRIPVYGVSWAVLLTLWIAVVVQVSQHSA